MHPVLMELEPRFADLEAQLADVERKRKAITDRVAASQSAHAAAVRQAIDEGTTVPTFEPEPVEQALAELDRERGTLDRQRRDLLIERAPDLAERLQVLAAAELEKAAEVVEQLRPTQRALVDLAAAHREVAEPYNRWADGSGQILRRLRPAVADVPLTEVVRGVLGAGDVITRSPLREGT